MDGRRIDLSATQVIASMLAAITGAVAASTLGIAGTVIGAAIMSIASTAVAAIYKHYLARSRERLRKAAEAARVSPLVSNGAAGAIRGRHRTGSAQTTPSVAATRVDAGKTVDADKTQVLPVLGSTQHRWHDADRANGFGRPDDATQLMGGGGDGVHRPDDATQLLSGRSATAAEAGAAMAGGTTRPGGATEDLARTAGQPAPGTKTGGGPPREDTERPWWRRPFMLAGVAVGIFLLAMAGITAFEAAAGKPLDALVGGKHGSGTTIGSLVGGQSTRTVTHRTSPTPTPASTPTPTPASSATPSSTPSPAPTPSPTSAPTPTPTTGSGDSPAVNANASARPAASASTP
jgi:hypothetical protein